MIKLQKKRQIMNHAEIFKAHEEQFDVDLGTEHYFSDGLYAKRMRIPAGLMVFDTTLAKLCVYSGAAWQTITSI